MINEPELSKPDFAHAEHAIGLTYLHQRVREQAIQRIEQENRVNGSEGVRRQYQALVRSQFEMQHLLSDFQTDRSFMTQNQEERYHSMNRATKLSAEVRSPPKLEVMTRLLNRPEGSLVPLTEEEEAARQWLASMKMPGVHTSDISKKEDREHLDRAIENHLQAKETVLRPAKWSAVYVPSVEGGR